MALSFFKKDKPVAAGETESGGFKRDPRKANAFFKHAQATADSRQYDYSITCYVNGLRHDPDNMARHEALREVAMRRKVSGLKPAGLLEGLKSGGKTPLDKMLHAEQLWAKDPLNAGLAMSVMENAVDAHKAETDLDLTEVVNWIGGLVLEPGQSSKKLGKSQFVKVRDLLFAVGAFDRAAEACKRAIQLDPNDASLLHDLKNIEAEQTMQKSGMGGGEGDFRKAIKDVDRQRVLEQEGGTAKTTSVIDEMIARRRVEYEESPEDAGKLARFIEALLQRGTNATDDEAIRVLTEQWEQSGQYRHKVRIGDIQMKRYNREVRELRQHLAENPEDESTRRIMVEMARKQLAFELEEYQERVKNYPTDKALRFELGRRLFATQQYDEAIAAFQEARDDPKRRAASLLYLGKCYIAKQWFDEATDALRQGIAGYELTDDRIALDLRYDLMDALENQARRNKTVEPAREAQKVASEILQANITYRDIRQRLEKIKALVSELESAA